jgi:AcrR family transcriptional regulator
MSPELDPRVERTRKVVLAAAIDELIEVGFERLTIDSVAERSGVARSTIYRNWCDRPTLLIEAFRLLSRDDMDGPPSTGTLVGDLEQLAERLLDRLRDERWLCTVPSLIGAATHDQGLRELMTAFVADRRKEARQVLERAVERGEIEDRGRFDSTMERFVGPFFIRALMSHLPLDDDFVRSQVEATVAELRAGPDGPGPG